MWSGTMSNPSRKSITPSSPGLPVGAATVRAPGHCGELVQGMLDDRYFLVACPIDFFGRVRVELYQGGPGIEAPADCPKAAAAVKAALAHLGREELLARLTVNSPIPRGKGMGSSSVDVTSAIAATGLALGQELPPAEIGRLALSVEPTDGIMFPGIAIFDHREGRIAEVLGPPPPMEIVALDFGGKVDTLEFNRVDRRPVWQSLREEAAEALQLVRLGVRRCDPALVGRGASISARAAQRVLFKPQLPQVMDFVHSVGAVGVNVGHSGTIIGVLLDARPRRGKSTFHQAQRAFPEAEMVQHFRLLGGGLRHVPEDS